MIYPNMFPQAQQEPQSNVDFVFVNCMDAAWNVQVPSGCVRWMMNNDGTELYVKAVDMTGAVNKRVVRLEDITEQALAEHKTVTPEQYDELIRRIAILEGRV